jgi:hypothetical protein
MNLEYENATGIDEHLAEKRACAPRASCDPYSTRVARGRGRFQKDVRESMAVLPAWMQPLLTHITGKPLPWESPRFAPRPLLNLLIALNALLLLMAVPLYLLGVSAGLAALMLPPCWVLSTGILRTLQVVYGHQAAHRLLVRKSQRINQLLLDLLTTIPLAQNGVEYRRDHFGHHNRSIFTTRDDSDAAFLHEFGFRPGRSRNGLWRNLLFTLVSPRFHFVFLRARLRSSFSAQRPFLWRVASLIWALFLTLGLCTIFPWWHVGLAVWFPYFVFYNMSALLQFSTEHAWLVTAEAPQDLAAYADRCWGRFLGESCPSPALRGFKRITLWGRWWFRMLFFHAPIRYGVIVGDLPAHDWHHLCGFLKDDPGSWPSAIYARQRSIDRGNGMGMERRELWGLTDMLNELFSALEATPPANAI